MTESKIRVIIHWVRHAESSSNIHRPTGSDIYDTERNCGFRKNTNYVEQTDKIVDVPDEISDEDKQLIEQKKERSLVSLISGLWKFLSTALYEPNLSYRGTQQAILLGTNFIEENNQKYDGILCSTMTRTCMTTLFATRKLVGNKIIVVPYISEELKVFVGKIDNTNLPNPSDLLKKKVALIKDWISYNWINRYDDIEIMTSLLEIYDDKNTDEELRELIEKLLFNDKLQKLEVRITENILKIIIKKYPHLVTKYPKIFETYKVIAQNIRGLPFDFSILDEYEKMKEYKEDPYPNSERFYRETLPIIISKFSKGNLTATYKLLIVSHGDYIRCIMNKYHQIDQTSIANTEVFDQIIE